MKLDCMFNVVMEAKRGDFGSKTLPQPDYEDQCFLPGYIDMESVCHKKSDQLPPDTDP